MHKEHFVQVVKINASSWSGQVAFDLNVGSIKARGERSGCVRRDYIIHASSWAINASSAWWDLFFFSPQIRKKDGQINGRRQKHPVTSCMKYLKESSISVRLVKRSTNDDNLASWSSKNDPLLFIETRTHVKSVASSSCSNGMDRIYRLRERHHGLIVEVDSIINFLNTLMLLLVLLLLLLLLWLGIRFDPTCRAVAQLLWRCRW